MSELRHVYVFGSTMVEVWDDNVRTLIEGWPADGRPIVAAPRGGESMRDCVDHELAHTWIAWHYTGRPSPVMLRQAKLLNRHAQFDWEEHVVLTYVRGLADEVSRPWDYYRVGPS